MEDPFIKSVAKIAYAEDLSRAIVTFTTDNGVVTYQFSIFDLQTIVGAMSQMVLFAQSQTQSMGYHFVTPVLDLADAMAAPVADKNKVVLSVKLQNGIFCEFGLEPSVATRLREDMEKGGEDIAGSPFTLPALNRPPTISSLGNLLISPPSQRFCHKLWIEVPTPK